MGGPAAPPTGVRGWDIYVGIVTVFVGLSTTPQDPKVGYWLGPYVALAAWYVVVGRRAVKVRDVAWSSVYMSGNAVLLAWAVFRDPWLSPLQIIVMPLVWWLCLPEWRRALVWTVVTCVVCAGGLGAYAFFVHVDTWSTAKTVIYLVAFPAVAIVASAVAGVWGDAMFRWGRDRMSLVADLRRMEDERVALEREAAAAEERLRMSREIHDTIAQDIAGLRLMAEQARRQSRGPDRVESEGEDGDDAVDPLEETLGLIASAAQRVFAETRDFIASTAPVASGRTIRASLVRVVDRFVHETGIVVTADVADLSLPRDVEVVLVRCVQEGLADVRERAGAGRVWLALAADGHSAVLTIMDDGGGMSEGAARSVGLSAMAARVRETGGVLTVEPAGAGLGVRLRVNLPLEAVNVPERA
ncbi:MAG: histidine kinase [Actinomycetia bacterium]|nr:histidine kinase [Actinomycetes bacterium]